MLQVPALQRAIPFHTTLCLMVISSVSRASYLWARMITCNKVRPLEMCTVLTFMNYAQECTQRKL